MRILYVKFLNELTKEERIKVNPNKKVKSREQINCQLNEVCEILKLSLQYVTKKKMAHQDFESTRAKLRITQPGDKHY